MLVAGGVYLASSVAIAAWLMPTGREHPPVSFAAPRDKPEWGKETTAAHLRTLALRQARVWMPANPAAVDLAANPPDSNGLLSQPIVRCRYLDGPARGTTAEVRLRPARRRSREGEVRQHRRDSRRARGKRLLAALGFGADRMFLVPRVRCYGCVRTPFYTMQVLDYVHARERLEPQRARRTATPTSNGSAVERRLDGEEIEVAGEDGWAWYELDPIDPARGANRAERDALRLAAMLLAHWDNKASNQRLMCLSPGSPGAGLHAAIRLHRTISAPPSARTKWTSSTGAGTPVWADRVAMPRQHAPVSLQRRHLSRHSQISEAGRQLLARQLSAPHRTPAGRAVHRRTLPRVPRRSRIRRRRPEALGGARSSTRSRQIADAGPCAE